MKIIGLLLSYIISHDLTTVFQPPVESGEGWEWNCNVVILWSGNVLQTAVKDHCSCPACSLTQIIIAFQIRQLESSRWQVFIWLPGKYRNNLKCQGKIAPNLGACKRRATQTKATLQPDIKKSWVDYKWQILGNYLLWCQTKLVYTGIIK